MSRDIVFKERNSTGGWDWVTVDEVGNIWTYHDPRDYGVDGKTLPVEEPACHTLLECDDPMYLEIVSKWSPDYAAEHVKWLAERAKEVASGSLSLSTQKDGRYE
jgi:hypothetical protein